MAVRKIFIAEISRAAPYTYNRAHARARARAQGWTRASNESAACEIGGNARACRCVRALRTVFESTRPSCRIDDTSIRRFDDRSFHSRASRCRYHGRLGETRELPTLSRGAFK